MRFRFRALTSKIWEYQRAVRSFVVDAREFWTEFASIVEDELSSNFRSRGTLRSRGGVWAPISRATRLWRKRRGYSQSDPPLTASGELAKSLRSGSLHIKQIERKSLTVGTRHPFAAPHQFGATIDVRAKSEKQKKSGRGRKQKKIKHTIYIPARPFVPESSNSSLAAKLSRSAEMFLVRLLSRITGKAQEV